MAEPAAAKPSVGFALKGKAPKVRRPAAAAAGAAAGAGEKDVIVAIGDGGIQSLKPKVREGPKVIQPLANNWQLHGSRQGDQAQQQAQQPAATAASAADEEAVAALVKDAQRLDGQLVDADAGAGSMVIEGGGMTTEQRESDSQLGAAAGVAEKGREGLAEPEKSEDDKYREDVAWRPQEESVHSASWEAMPIEAFGSALLRGMGWKEGKGIGLNAKGDATAQELIPRHQRLGLGATPKAPEPKRPGWIPKPGESRQPKPDMVLRDKDGVEKHRKNVGDKLEVRVKKIEPGASVSVVGGRHKGMSGRVRSMEQLSGNVLVELTNDEEVTCKIGDLKLFDEQAEREQRSSRKRGHEERREHKKSKKHKKEKSKKHKKESSAKERLWVAAGLRVRIIGKELWRGKHYNKKAVVQDVQGRKDVLLQLESGELLEGAPQSALETLVPKPGADGRALVMVVSGRAEYKGKHADVLQRSKGGNSVTVQMKHDDAVVQLTMDDVCEYVGALQE